MITSFSNTNKIKDHNFLIFELIIIEVCNQNCSYCYMRNESPSWKSFSSYKKICDVIDKLCEINKPISICLSGGESTLHPNIINIIKYLKSKNIFDIHINTNLQLSSEKLQNIIDEHKDTIFHISYHYEADDNFISKLKMIDPKNRELNVMIDPDKKKHEKLERYINELISENINFYLKPVYINSKFKPTKNTISIMEKYSKYTTKEYIDNNNKLYNDYDLYMSKIIPMNTFNWKCYYIFFTITCSTGNIKQMCKLFNLSNIFDDIEFFKNYDLQKPQICPFTNSCLWASSLDHYKERK